MPPERYLGLLSGTSVDGVDAALLRFEGEGVALEATRCRPYERSLRELLATLCTPGGDDVDSFGQADTLVADAFAETALALLGEGGIDPATVTAIGSHGQTVRHRPGGNTPFTLQLGDPSRLAERTGISVVADFRRRDLAAGGEGAPLAPAFHRALFGRPGVRRAIVNIGGIANATLLDGTALLAGFDTGPGNTLLDAWCRRHHGAPYDAGGAWGAEGRVLPDLLACCLADSYFERTGPRSTGREYFDGAWLDRRLAPGTAAAPRDVQATLAALTATSIQGALARAGFDAEEIYVCGGGAHNDDLMRRLQAAFAPARLATTADLGLAPDWVEGAAFAWLARQRLAGRTGNAPAVTGARGERVLGAVYPGRWVPNR